jgi:O-antigen ligase
MARTPPEAQLAPPDRTLGLPRFEAPLPFIAFCFYTFVVVTYFVRGADVAIAVAAIAVALRKEPLRFPAPVWIFAAYVLWGLVSASFSNFADLAYERNVEDLKLLVIMAIAINVLRTPGQVRFYAMFFVGCFVLFPVRGTLVGDDSLMGRVVWNYIYNNPNDLASLCLITLGLAFALLFARPASTLVKVAAAASAMLLTGVILLTQSRGAFIGLCVGFGIPLLLRGLRTPVRSALAVGLAAVAAAAFVPDRVWDRLSGIEKLSSTSTIAEADPEGSAEQRFELQKVGVRMMLDNPVLGVGPGAFASAFERYDPALGKKDTHNTYLNVAAEFGIPGFLLWVAFVLSVLVYAWRSRRAAVPGRESQQQLWIEAGIWAYLVAGIFGSYAKLTFPYLILAVLWCSAATLVPRQATRREGGPPPAA